MLLMIFYYIVVRMPLAYLLSGLGVGLNGIWAAVLVSHAAASAAAGVFGAASLKNFSKIGQVLDSSAEIRYHNPRTK